MIKYPALNTTSEPEEVQAERLTLDTPRHGPVRMRHLSAGRQAGRVRRAKAASERKLNRRHRRNFIAKQWPHAVLRGQLQAVGALPYSDPERRPTLKQRLDAGTALVRKFGERDGAGDLIESDTLFIDSLKRARQAYGA